MTFQPVSWGSSPGRLSQAATACGFGAPADLAQVEPARGGQARGQDQERPGREVTRTAWAIMASRSKGLLAAREFSSC